MKNVLVPIDGSDSSIRALQAAINMAKLQSTSAKIYALNVQPPIISNNVARFFSPEVLHSYYHDEGQHALIQASALLKAHPLDHEIHIEVGHITDVIKTYVDRYKLDHIVMGTRGLSAVPGLLLGSVATKVLSSVTIPVTLVK